MTKSQRYQKRQEARLRAALNAHKQGLSVRKAARIAQLSKSAFHRRVHSMIGQNHPATPSAKRDQNRALSGEEEATICQLLVREAEGGLPLTWRDLNDAVYMFSSTLSLERQAKLPFENRTPGRDFLRNFLKRNAETIRLGRPAKECEERWRACNSDTLTTHLASFENVLVENRITASQLYNLDEPGATPNHDTSKRTCQNMTLRTSMSNTTQVGTTHFRNVDKIAMMATVCADGSSFPPCFLLKGMRIPYWEIVIDNRYEMESVFDCLPDGSLLTVRNETASVDQLNFADWARHFVTAMRPNTMNGRKVLLTHNRYRCHITLRALDILSKGGIIAYCLLVHTSGKHSH